VAKAYRTDFEPSTTSVQIFQETSFMPIAWRIALGMKVAGGAEVMPSAWKIPKKIS
jgi:hypothetical protein